MDFRSEELVKIDQIYKLAIYRKKLLKKVITKRKSVLKTRSAMTLAESFLLQQENILGDTENKLNKLREELLKDLLIKPEGLQLDTAAEEYLQATREI